MKFAFLAIIALFVVVAPAYGQLLSDATGLVNRLDIESGGHNYEVEVVSNFDISDYSFNENEKKLTIFLESGLENNLGEMIIPQKLLSGNFTFYLDENEFTPNLKSNEKISFVTLNFTGTGNHTLEIIAIESLNEVPKSDDKEIPDTQPPSEDDDKSNGNDGGGCLIATATFGSELSPQVQQLREIRDNQFLQTQSGIEFMNFFNNVYYSFSPIVADYERENPFFKESVKLLITPMLYSLSILNYTELNSEYDVLGYGISLILLNAGIYLAAPTIVLSQIIKFTKSKIN